MSQVERWRLNRRTVLRLLSGAAGGAVMLATGASSMAPRRSLAQSADPLAKFVDPLPIMRVIRRHSMVGGVPSYVITMKRSSQRLHRDVPPTTVWGYEGLYPGPTFEVTTGQPIQVTWQNALPGRHALPVDPTIHGAQPPTPEVRTVVHVHGLKVRPESDGYPEAWFTNGFRQTGPFFTTRTYHYPNDQRAATLWYHDHALGITRLNLYMGLEGFYLIRDEAERDLRLPSGRYEIPLMIQDRSLNPDGSLFYPVQEPGDPEVPPVWVPEFFGDTILVNGKVWPFLEVEPRRYRFRILNASNARFYRLALHESTSDGSRLGRPGPAFALIGTDGGFVPAPVSVPDLTIAPAERFDVIVDFTGAGGRSFVLGNDANAPFPDGDDVVPTDVMLFKVGERSSGRDTSAIPPTLPAAPSPNPSTAVATRDLVLVEIASAADNPIMGLINTHWEDPVTESPRAGAVEVWRIINTTEDAHPIHVHLVQFHVLDRQPFDVSRFPERLIFTGPPVTPPPDERLAPKDTVKAFPGEVTRIIAKFDLPTGTPVSPGDRFRYVFHCHILEHEDNDMMRPYDVVG